VTRLLEGMSFTQLKLLVPQDPGLIIVGPLNILLLTWNHCELDKPSIVNYRKRK